MPASLTGVFAARPPARPTEPRDLYLTGTARRAFTGSTEFLSDPQNRARVGEYLADLARPYSIEIGPDLAGHSYGEMAEPLIAELTSPDEPVDLLVLAFSGHDLRPGRPTAAYLSDVTPGAPMAFAICDQGSAAPFSALRIAREYVASAGVRRALLIAVEQAGIPYQCQARLPSEHRAVAMLYGDAARATVRVVEVSQHSDVPLGQAAGCAAAQAARLSADDHPVTLVLSDSLAEVWSVPVGGRVRVMPASQPFTGVWWGVIDELSARSGSRVRVIAADYDPDLHYLCLTAFEKEPAEWETP